MKRAMLVLCLVAFTLSGKAQVLKSNLLNGYKQGDKLEKAVYQNSNDPIKKDTWCKAFAPKSDESITNPTIGKGLTYEGYPEKGPSICLGGFPVGTRGSRFSVCSISDRNDYCRGTIYLSFLADFSKVESSRVVDFIALSANHTGDYLRARVFVGKVDDEHIRFGTNLLRINAESFKSHALNKTHLLVLKLDYDRNEVSLFVDPTLAAEEPQPDIVAKGDDSNNKLKGSIRSISIRNRNDLTGNIGNFRLSSNWTGVISQ